MWLRRFVAEKSFIRLEPAKCWPRTPKSAHRRTIFAGRETCCGGSYKKTQVYSNGASLICPFYQDARNLVGPSLVGHSLDVSRRPVQCRRRLRYYRVAYRQGWLARQHWAVGLKVFWSQGQFSGAYYFYDTHKVQAGVVIASPSTTDPDYLFTWTRDAALVLKTIIDSYVK